ncbi:MAG: hypothetical protein IKJ81_09665 [Bacteroidales bacterium]|nr:hypothetical protein [Bacteroidales bacterium]
MNILAKIAARRYEERKQVRRALARSGKSLEDAVAEAEQYMCNRYGENWRTGMPPNYSSRPQRKRKSFIQRIKDFFRHHE